MNTMLRWQGPMHKNKLKHQTYTSNKRAIQYNTIQCTATISMNLSNTFKHGKSHTFIHFGDCEMVLVIFFMVVVVRTATRRYFLFGWDFIWNWVSLISPYIDRTSAKLRNKQFTLTSSNKVGYRSSNGSISVFKCGQPTGSK